VKGQEMFVPPTSMTAIFVVAGIVGTYLAVAPIPDRAKTNPDMLKRYQNTKRAMRWMGPLCLVAGIAFLVLQLIHWAQAQPGR
jgi:hypothetical protein